jgi:hypothetical protein
MPPVPDIHSPRRGGGHNSLAASWSTAPYDFPEAILLASDVPATRVFTGEWDGPIGDGGSCDAVDTNGLQEVFLRAGRCYAGNVTCLHESLPVAVDCNRTLVRLNVPGWSP